ncbi:MAG TPA: disulfide bond formation protein B [Desulfobacteraceae bacterium]|nr:disulfide bond formation protein B [Desulfobacteraceae bacterium]
MFDRYKASDINWTLLLTAWGIATASALGSIFFSHVMEFAPCVLCWYQRICLFPLVIILATGLFPFDGRVIKYALPLAVIGWGTALYHTLLYAGIISKELSPCTQGISCTEKYIELFGFISIPMMSLMAFSLIIAVLIVLKIRTNKNEI